MKYHFLIFINIIGICSSAIFAQTRSDDLNIFGYFQVTFMQFSEQEYNSTRPEISGSDWQPAQNTFSIQHLNLFLSKNISDHWRAFINFEFTNSFSSYKNWGSFNLEEVWIRYKPSDAFGTQAGLLIPTFNNLNEIKNRTPLLPYIFRPFVYETSLKDFFFFIEDFIPSRAWLQVSGTLKHREIKFDYAFYTGNSPNISETGEYAPSGYDTTNTFLFGGRIGMRWMDLKAGFSMTYDKQNLYMTDGIYNLNFNRMPRYRLGADLSFQAGGGYAEGEFIKLMRDEQSLRIIRNNETIANAVTDFRLDGTFLYGMLLFNMTDRFRFYLSYSQADLYVPFIAAILPVPVIHETKGEMGLPTIGVAWQVNENVLIKAQYVRMNITEFSKLTDTPDLKIDQGRSIMILAGSVLF